MTKFTFNGILSLNLRGIGKPKSAFPAIIRPKHWSSQGNGRLIFCLLIEVEGDPILTSALQEDQSWKIAGSYIIGAAQLVNYSGGIIADFDVLYAFSEDNATIAACGRRAFLIYVEEITTGPNEQGR